MVLLENMIALWTPQSAKPYAAPKAREDIHRIMVEMGLSPVLLDKDFGGLSAVEDYSGVVLQYPLKPFVDPGISSGDGYRLLSLIKGNGLVVVVHDIKSLQKTMFDKNVSSQVMSEVRAFEERLFSQADVLVVHSQAMAEYLVDDFGLHDKRFVCLDMFDYLGPVEGHVQGEGVAFAGYLGQSKRGCVDVLCAGLPQGRFSFHFYGLDFDQSCTSREDIFYRGSFVSDALPQILERENQFGLIWDTLTPKQRVYYDLITPHKASLYIRAGLPLIVPEGTNIARFALEHRVGIPIRSLSDIADIALGDGASLESLQRMVGEGYFTKKAIISACEYL